MPLHGNLCTVEHDDDTVAAPAGKQMHVTVSYYQQWTHKNNYISEMFYFATLKHINNCSLLNNVSYHLKSDFFGYQTVMRL